MRTIGDGVRFPIRRQVRSTPASSTKTSSARKSGTIRSPIPPKPKNVVRNIPIAVERIMPTTHGRTPERNAFAVLPIKGYRANLPDRAAIAVMMQNDGNTTPSVAASAPANPPTLEPFYDVQGASMNSILLIGATYFFNIT